MTTRRSFLVTAAAPIVSFAVPPADQLVLGTWRIAAGCALSAPRFNVGRAQK